MESSPFHKMKTRPTMNVIYLYIISGPLYCCVSIKRCVFAFNVSLIQSLSGKWPQFIAYLLYAWPRANRFSLVKTKCGIWMTWRVFFHSLNLKLVRFPTSSIHSLFTLYSPVSFRGDFCLYSIVSRWLCEQGPYSHLTYFHFNQLHQWVISDFLLV